MNVSRPHTNTTAQRLGARGTITCGKSETPAVSDIRRRQAVQLRNPEAIAQPRPLSNVALRACQQATGRRSPHRGESYNYLMDREDLRRRRSIRPPRKAPLIPSNAACAKKLEASANILTPDGMMP